jgi:hypothetical protein
MGPDFIGSLVRNSQKKSSSITKTNAVRQITAMAGSFIRSKVTVTEANAFFPIVGLLMTA